MISKLYRILGYYYFRSLLFYYYPDSALAVVLRCKGYTSRLPAKGTGFILLSRLIKPSFLLSSNHVFIAEVVVATLIIGSTTTK